QRGYLGDDHELPTRPRPRDHQWLGHPGPAAADGDAGTYSVRLNPALWRRCPMPGPRITVLLAGFLTAVTSAGCDSSSQVSSSSSPSSSAATAEVVDAATTSAPIAELPVTLTLEQRSTTPIPGSDGKLSLTIGD